MQSLSLILGDVFVYKNNTVVFLQSHMKGHSFTFPLKPPIIELVNVHVYYTYIHLLQHDYTCISYIIRPDIYIFTLAVLVSGTQSRVQ